MMGKPQSLFYKGHLLEVILHEILKSVNQIIIKQQSVAQVGKKYFVSPPFLIFFKMFCTFLLQ